MAADSSLSSKIGAVLRDVEKGLDRRRRATVQSMEALDRRLKHIAYLTATLDLRVVIPKLTELASMFPHATAPKREGLCDRFSVDFLPTAEYPAQARVSVGLAPLPTAETLRVTFSVIMLPVHLQYESEARLDLAVENPDWGKLEAFLDEKILRFVRDYVRVRDPGSAYHDEQKVTDPVCKMTFSVVEAATSFVWKDKTYYFCVDGCRRKFEAAPDRYLERPLMVKDLPSHERPQLLDATPGERPPGTRA